MSIKTVIIHHDSAKAQAIKRGLISDKQLFVKSTFTSASDGLNYAVSNELNLIILGEKLDDEQTAYDFILDLMKIKPCACLVVNELGEQVEIKDPRALDYSIVDTYTAEFQKEKLLFPARMLIKVKILSKLNISKFQTQIDQINNSSSSKQVKLPKKMRVPHSSRHLKRIRRSTSEKLRSRSPSLVSIPTKNKYESIIVMGASTGGPRMLVYIISQLPSDFPAVLVVQHMPKGFMGQFAARIDANSQMNAKLAEDGDRILPGNVYVAPGGYHLEIEGSNRSNVRIRITDGPKINFVKPAFDVTLFAAARIYGTGAIGVVLTGMGSDGREGSRVVKKKGGYIIALNEEDSTIFGMNKAVIDAGLADEIVGMDGIVRSIGSHLSL